MAIAENNNAIGYRRDGSAMPSAAFAVKLLKKPACSDPLVFATKNTANKSPKNHLLPIAGCSRIYKIEQLENDICVIPRVGYYIDIDLRMDLCIIN